MPVYVIKNIKTNEEVEITCSYDELKQAVADPDIQQVFTPIRVVSGVGGINSKTDDGFKDTLRRIKSGAGRDNTINI